MSNTYGFILLIACSSSSLCLNSHSGLSPPPGLFRMAGSDRTSHCPGSARMRYPHRSSSCKRCMIITMGVPRELTRLRIVVSKRWFTFSRRTSESASSGFMGSSITIAPENKNEPEEMPSTSSATSSTFPAPKPVICPPVEVAYTPPPAVVTHFFLESEPSFIFT